MSAARDAELLLAHWDFAGSDPAALAALLAACPERTVAPGEVLIKERSYGDEMFFLLEGRVSVHRLDPRGEPRALATLSAPDLLGHLSLIDNSPRSASVVASEPARVRVLDRKTWARLSVASSREASTLRRLLLSALHGQLSEAHARTVAGSGGAAAEPFDELLVHPR